MSRRFGGTGLGTTISKQLVELMGGEISVQSREGVGSCFSFRLPLQPGVASSTASAGALPQLPPLRLLIADDIPQNLELLQLLLQRAGHQVWTASNGEQALQAVRQQQFDLVLMDIQMPVLDGLQACRLLRQEEQATGRPQLPVIALTASVLAEDKHAAMAAGMQGFASKPVDFSALCLEIATVLQLDIASPLTTSSGSGTLVVSPAESKQSTATLGAMVGLSTSLTAVSAATATFVTASLRLVTTRELSGITTTGPCHQRQ